MLADQKSDVRKNRYDGIIGLSDIEVKMEDLTKKVRRLQNIIQSLVLELNTKKKMVVNSFLGYSKDGKMILDWKLDDINPPCNSPQTPIHEKFQNISILEESQVLNQQDSPDAYEGQSLRDLPTHSNSDYSQPQKNDFYKTSNVNTGNRLDHLNKKTIALTHNFI